MRFLLHDLPPFLYILDGKTPVPCDDPLVWAEWFVTHDHHVADEWIGPLRVSTIFTGRDVGHAFFGLDRPLFFETMVFGQGSLAGAADQYTTWEQAEAGHQAMVQRVKGILH